MKKLKLTRIHEMLDYLKSDGYSITVFVKASASRNYVYYDVFINVTKDGALYCSKFSGSNINKHHLKGSEFAPMVENAVSFDVQNKISSLTFSANSNIARAFREIVFNMCEDGLLVS